MITIYTWDATGNYAGVLEVDPHGAMPDRSTTRQPVDAEVHWVGDGWAPGLLPTPPDPGPTPQEMALLTIQQMEREQLMARITREAILRMAEKEADELAAEHGVDAAFLLSKNKGYTALKLFDDQIAALREQL